jgi:hypothetical protein
MPAADFNGELFVARPVEIKVKKILIPFEANSSYLPGVGTG